MITKKKDIQNRADIILLVDTFYNKVKTDTKIGFLFTEVAKVNWDSHLTKMYDFWENILFHTGNFEGNPMQKHKELYQKHPLTPHHFMHWNMLFIKTVNELFSGIHANEIIERALRISSVMQHHTIGD